MKKLLIGLLGLTAGAILFSGVVAQAATCAGVYVGGTGICYPNIPKAHTVILGSGSSAFGTTSPSTATYVLTSNGVGADPTFQPATGGGSSFGWPFTVRSWGASTSTTLGFYNGFLSTASSTINAVFRLPLLAKGLSFIGNGGLLGSTATTTASCSGSASCTPFTILGSSPITISASGGSGSAFPFTPHTGYNSTSTVLGFNGFFSSASSTISYLGTGLVGANNGRLYKFATSTIKTSQLTNDSGFLTGVTADSPLSGSGTAASHLVLSTAGTWSGNAGTATALAANGTNCTAGNYPLGVDASGNSENCTAAAAALTFKWPLVNAANSVSFNATTTPWAKNQFVYTNAAGLLVTAASSTLAIPNTGLANSTISGVSLGGTLAALTAGTTLTSAGTYTGNTARTFDIDLTHANSWTGKQTFANSTTTLGSFAYASSTAYYGAGLGTCNGSTSALTWAAGKYGCHTISGGSGAAFAWTPTQHWGQLTSATTTALWLHPSSKFSLFASSTALFDYATSTMMTVRNSLRIGTTTLATLPSYLDIIGYDNSINGVQAGIINRSAGISAYDGLYLNNNIADTSVTHFGFLGQNSSNYSDQTFGSLYAVKNLVFLQNTDGPLLFSASTTASSVSGQGYLNFATNNVERMRILSSGLIGIGTTTPLIGGLTSSSATAPQFTLSPGTAGKLSWAFRATPSGTLYIATTTTKGNATTTLSALSIGSNGTIVTPAVRPATTTAIVLNWASTPQQVEYRIGTSATTITLIGATTSQMWGSAKRVYVCNPGSTAGALTWKGVEWIGTAPAQTTTANQCDVYSFNINHATSTAYKVAGTSGSGFK